MSGREIQRPEKKKNNPHIGIGSWKRQFIREISPWISQQHGQQSELSAASAASLTAPPHASVERFRICCSQGSAHLPIAIGFVAFCLQLMFL